MSRRDVFVGGTGYEATGSPLSQCARTAEGGNWGETQNKQGLNSPQWEYTKISLKNVCSLGNLSWTVQHLQNSLLFSFQMNKHLDLAN